MKKKRMEKESSGEKGKVTLRNNKHRVSFKKKQEASINSFR